MHRRAYPVLAFALVCLAASAADAHIALSSPPPRHVEQKNGPCGVGPDDARGPNVTTFQGGETILVRWTETVQHPGHFRISFDGDGHDDFGDPAGYDDFYSNPAVLIDEIADKVESQAMYEQEITLPMMSCDNCTLQLIQVMTDKPPYELGTNDLYYQCADIVLEGAAATTGESTSGDTSGDTSGGESSTDATSGDSTSGEPTTGSTISGSTSGDEPGTTTGSDTDPTGNGGDTTAAIGSTGGDSPGSATSPSDMEEASGCGSCSTEGPGGAGLGALLLVLARRRRRV